MAIINLKEFYPWYTQDEFIEVTDEVAKEMQADKRYEKANRRRMQRNKVKHSIDSYNGIENNMSFTAMSPHEVMEYKDSFCRLCYALNSLTEAQGRRIEKYFIHGMSKAGIAKKEGVAVNAVKESINRGLYNMKKYLRNFRNTLSFDHQSDAIL